MMAQDSIDQATVDISDDQSSAELERSGSFSRLNAHAPEFVPRPNQQQRIVKVHHRHHHHQPPPPPPPPSMTAVVHVFHPPTFLSPAAMAPPAAYEYFGGAGVGGFVEEEAVVLQQPEPETASPAREELSDDVAQKITKQVEYYFSDANLATTEHLMRFISKDPEGFVPISVIATFKKIKALVHNNSLLANALRTSAKLVVSDDGKKVRRQQPITEADVDELQARIVVAENLPDDHHYQNLMKIFSAVGSVKTIRTCYPQTPNGSTPPTNRSAKMDMLFGNRLHAFVEYETIEDAEKAVSELNDNKNWRGGLRVRLLNKCMTKNRLVRGRKGATLEADVYGEEEDVSVLNHPNEKQVEDLCQPCEPSHELLGEEVPHEREGGARRGRGRGRGGRGRGRVHQYHQNNNSRGGGHHHPVGTPPSSHQIHVEQAPVAVAKPPPGPRMPDGTRGFTMGRGKPLAAETASLSSVS